MMRVTLMYLQFYSLKEKPFSLSPDPKFLYYSSGHKEAISQMIYALTQNSGFMMLTGEVGTGKTILINSLTKNLPEKYLSAKIHFTVYNPRELMEDICREFGIAFTGDSLSDLVLKLQEFLKWRYHMGRKSVLIIDEAQNLSWESLEIVRLLSNVEAMHEKFFQIILVGQPEFEEKLKAHDLRQLNQRIGLRFRLGALGREETSDYIVHRLAVARSKHAEKIFSRGAVQRIHEFSRGVPRRINILCDNALLFGYATDTRSIDEAIIEEVGKDDGAGRDAAWTQEDIQSPVAIAKASKEKKLGVASELENGNGEKAVIAKQKSRHASESDIIHGQFQRDDDLLILKKPRIGTIFIIALLWFFVLSIALFCAVLLAVKLGFIVFG
jgi:general secretion pathway protein A